MDLAPGDGWKDETWQSAWERTHHSDSMLFEVKGQRSDDGDRARYKSRGDSRRPTSQSEQQTQQAESEEKRRHFCEPDFLNQLSQAREEIGGCQRQPEELVQL